MAAKKQLATVDDAALALTARCGCVSERSAWLGGYRQPPLPYCEEGFASEQTPSRRTVTLAPAANYGDGLPPVSRVQPLHASSTVFGTGFSPFE